MKVRDIMRREVVTVHPDDTVGRLMDVLTTAAISGAPVIDGGGNVLGVVSTHDVLRLAADRTRREHRAERGPVVPEPGRAPNNGRAAEPAALAKPDYFVSTESATRPGALVPETYLETRVGDIMTPAIFRVRAEATLPELARFLSRAGVRRALVMSRGRLVGLVSVTDVVRALAGDREGSVA